MRGDADRGAVSRKMRKSSLSRAIGPRLMSQIIHARFEDGVLKPEDPLDLPPNARVRLVVVPMSDLGLESVAAWREIERLWGDVDIDSGGPPPKPRRVA